MTEKLEKEEAPRLTLIDLLRQDDSDPDIDFEPPRMELHFVVPDFFDDEEDRR